MVLVVVALVAQWAREDRRAASRSDRHADSGYADDELDAYNPLIPDGANFKATLLIEYPDPEVRARKLVELRDIEHRIALHVGGLAPIAAIADEDMERSNAEKTSAVHFLRFELPPAHVAAFKRGDAVELAVDHPAYQGKTTLDAPTHAALAADLD